MTPKLLPKSDFQAIQDRWYPPRRQTISGESVMRDLRDVIEYAAFLEKALEQATGSMAIVTIDDNNSGTYSKSFRWLEKEVITNVGFSENYIECGVGSAPELAGYLRSLETVKEEQKNG